MAFLLTCRMGGGTIPATMYALILAGGKGERLRPLTDTVPKPMVRVGGEPILAHQVNWLRTAGVTDVVFLVGYLGQMIEDYFRDGAAFGIRAHYSYEREPLGRGGALKCGLHGLINVERRVIATNGDVLTQADISKILADFDKRAAAGPSHMATILTVPMVSPYGIVDTDPEGKIIRFQEKSRLPHMINGGVYVLNPAIETFLPDVGDHETTTFPELAAAGRMSAVRTDKFWQSVDSFKDLNEVEAHLRTIMEAAKRGTS